MYGCGILIDLKKAFDTVNHTILLNKLEHCGIRGSCLKWFTSYLSNRSQYVSINNTISDTKHITCGVTQGLVLGSLLFLLYINDLPNISNQLHFFLFADDTNIYFKANNLDKIQEVMNKGLKLLREWLIANRLALNVSKTNFTIFSPPNKPYKNITLLINKKAIEQEYVKYLGVLLDTKLSFCHHISSIKKNISRAIGIMHKMKTFVYRNILICLYYSLVYPFLIYAIPIWGVACENIINPLYVLQKRVVRIITNKKGYIGSDGLLVCSAPLFYETGRLNICDIFKFHIAQFVFSCLNFNSPPQFHDYFVHVSNHYNTISSKNKLLRTPRVRTTKYGLNSVKYAGAFQ